jgi:stromal membrane-associated protein
VHITKIKSVNLDKWAPEVVEMYKHFSNLIANSYWEAKLPTNYVKPA